MNTNLLQFRHFFLMGSTHVVYYELFDQATIKYPSFLVTSCFLGRRPSCTCVVMLGGSVEYTNTNGAQQLVLRPCSLDP
jgi:hypothetical protein